MVYVEMVNAEDARNVTFYPYRDLLWTKTAALTRGLGTRLATFVSRSLS